MSATSDAALGPVSLAFTENWAVEDEVFASARARAREIGTSVVSASTGAALRLLAAMTDARAVVEVGTGAGVSGLWLLRGMRPDGVLTTVDIESEHQRAARQAFTDGDIAANRFRMINGSGAEVLPRLTDRGYDMVVIDADPTGYPGYFQAALRLLRPAGVMAFVGVLAGDRLADNSARDPQTLALRELSRMLRTDDQATAAMLPLGTGLLLAVRQ